jgi:ferritin
MRTNAMLPKMIISAELKNLLDDAVHSELYASNLYKHLANQVQRLGYLGVQKFFLRESATELEHYQLHANFQNDVGTVAEVPAIEAMTESIKSLSDAMELAYDTEMELYNNYKKWYAKAASDPAVQQFLLQFIEFQRTSVGEYGDLLSRIQLVDQDKAGMLLIDQELGA